MSHLPFPITSNTTHYYGNNRLTVAAASMHGWREYMEDSHSVVLKLPNHPDLAYFAVFDGHSGPEAADYMRDHLHLRIAELPDPTDPAALSNLFIMIDEELRQSREAPDSPEQRDLRAARETCRYCKDPFWHYRENPNDLRSPLIPNCLGHSTHKHYKSGCTASICIMDKRNNKMTTAHIGDSPIVVVSREGTIAFTTADHKPNHPDERARIYNSGSTISDGRVNGDLNLSRAFGDFRYKNRKDLPPQDQAITAWPTVSQRILNKDETVLIMCDGVTEALDKIEVASLATGNYDPAGTAEDILRKSIKCGSSDNQTIIIIQQRNGSHYGKLKKYTPMFVEPYMFKEPEFVKHLMEELHTYGMTLRRALLNTTTVNFRDMILSLPPDITDNALIKTVANY